MKSLKVLWVAWMSLCLCLTIYGCGRNDSDSRQQAQQEKILSEATNAIGMPAIKNFRERRILKDILELRDQEGIVTYTYMENLTPQVVRGHTALGGKLTYVGETIGYGIPYSTQYTNPEKLQYFGVNGGYHIIPQADPNGLFSPGAAEGTWLLMMDKKTNKVSPIYMEPRVVVLPFKLPMDGDIER